MLKKILLLLVCGLLICGGWFWFSLRPVNSANATSIIITIDPGQSVASIAQTLEDHGLLRSTLAFKIYVRLVGAQAKLQAGSFSLRQNQSLGDIVNALASGKTDEVSVTIPEGSTVATIDALVAAKGFGKPGDILDCAYACDFSDLDFVPKKNLAKRGDQYGSKLEGYLFPETYFVDPLDFAPEKFLRRMLETFRARVIVAHAQDIKTGGHSLGETLTMASLIEEESRAGGERPVVAGILWKRADAGTVLGVDATVRYVLRKPTGALLAADLDVASPYNTRKLAGLPPGPISNPGETAIAAALKPQKSDYWYYLHDRDGIIHYAVTNDEHNQNKARYLR